MLGYEEALALVLAQVRRLPTQRCAAARALGQVLAEAVISRADLPPFDNSAMDGFALSAGNALLPVGSEYAVAGAQAAGDAQVQATGGAWEIMTGARMPDGLDTVVPVEQVKVVAHDAAGRPLRIRLEAEAKSGQHLRRQGQDVAREFQVMAAGDELQAQHIALLAALGVVEVSVVRRPRIAIICTGRELVDDPAQALQSGQIRNSNGPFLAARAALAGADVVWQATVSDEPRDFRQAVEQALQAGADVLLSTGAVSMGRYDFVPDALREAGAHIHFHKVQIRPGRPLLFAQLSGGALFFGLPGNPASSAVGLRFFVEPALRAMLGMAPERPLKMPLQAPFENGAALRFFLKGEVIAGTDGRLCARVLPGQESFRVRPLLDANAWIVVREDAQRVEAGTLVDVYGLGHRQTPAITCTP